MKNIFTLFFVFCALALFSQGLTIDWANEYNMQGQGHNRTKIATDKFDNVYLTGIVNNPIDFDFSDSTNSIISGNGNSNLFLAKYDKNDNLLWLKKFTSTTSVIKLDIIIDSLGNIILVGLLQGGSGNIDADPNLGVQTVLTSLGNTFMIKLDAEANFVWVKQWNGFYIEDIDIDYLGGIYATGRMNDVSDFDPGVGDFTITPFNYDLFVLKLDLNGNFSWAKSVNNNGATGNVDGLSIEIDTSLNVYCAGVHDGVTDFDPGMQVYQLGIQDVGGNPFVFKLDSIGNFLWAQEFGTVNGETCPTLKLDSKQNVIIAGQYTGAVDVGSGTESCILPIYGGSFGGYVVKYDKDGVFKWGKSLGDGTYYVKSLAFDEDDNLFISSTFGGTGSQPSIFDSLGLEIYGQGDIFIIKLDSLGNVLDGIKYDNGDYNYDWASDLVFAKGGSLFFTGYGRVNLVDKYFLLKLSEKKIYGKFFKDFSQNCTWESNELGLNSFRAVINPGQIMVQSNAYGYWSYDSLPVGNYTMIFDSLSPWKANCDDSVQFSIVDSSDRIRISDAGFINQNPCSSPLVSISMPIVRRCFNNQKIFVKSWNGAPASEILTNAYTIVKLDENIIFDSASLAFVNLGNNQYRFNHGTLFPGESVNFSINATVSCDAVLGQTLCIEANLYPADSCTFDTIRSPQALDFVPCQLPWDKSSLTVRGWCENDSIYFTVRNNGEPINGDMDCYSPVRMYIDGQYIWLDSVKLLGGETRIFAFSGDGRTWRLEADQHPLHPGNSQPNAHVERCGNTDNWAPNRINIQAHDDFDAIKDIYCGLVTGSYDPNDKTGYPLGIGSSHLILPNGQIEYLIRFQNTGTDTAFTVVIRDTLDTDLNIFTVQSGASSHAYNFRMHGPRVLEWTFNNILLPDSTTNEPESHGFVNFTVNQIPNLSDSTEINNQVGIYFDYNDPVLTNITSHKIGRGIVNQQTYEYQTINLTNCGSIQYGNYTYEKTGTYYQLSQNLDTLTTINVSNQNSESSITELTCVSYTSPDNQVYTSSGTYTAILPNYLGCDSTITIYLTVNQVTNSMITESVCNSFTAPDNQVYTQSGTYTAIIPNSNGCDSIITINLTVNNPTSSAIAETVCNNYTAPDNQIYTQSGSYTAIIPNSNGCDSTITINLTVNTPTSSSISETVCDSYTAPDNQVYTQSGTYIAIIPNSHGCDSTITINLTVNNLISTITDESPSLISTVNNATYQWIDCLNGNQPIIGETNQSFTANDNGEYAVIVTQNSCSDTSECVLVSNVGLNEFSTEGISLFPNPTNGSIKVGLNNSYPEIFYKIINLSGQELLMSNKLSGEYFEIDLSTFSNGLYYLELDLGGKKEILKIIKE